MILRSRLVHLGLISRRASRRTLLMPALVEVALARLDRQLTRDEQEIVMRAVATPHLVNWPEWWEVRAGASGSG